MAMNQENKGLMGLSALPDEDQKPIFAEALSSADTGNASKSSRKRTKTGCLRYNPRAVYKDSHGDSHSYMTEGYQHDLESPIYASYQNPGIYDHQALFSQPQPLVPAPPPAVLAPRPASQVLQQGPGLHLQSQIAGAMPSNPQMHLPFVPSNTLPTTQSSPLNLYPTQSIDSDHDHVVTRNGTGVEFLSSPETSFPHQMIDFNTPIQSRFPHNASPFPLQTQYHPPIPDSQVSGASPTIIDTVSHDDQRAYIGRPGPSISARRSVSADARHEPETEDDMDFEMSAVESANLGKIQSQNLGLIIAVKATQRQGTARVAPRSSNSLATYRPSASASPLMNPDTARIFCHFVTITGPLLSIEERQVPNPTLLFSKNQISRAQQCIWTYTMPLMALGSPPLLQAILALACLHIAKLKDESVLPALKHYQLALRRVARCVSLPAKRNGIDVLAATLLLGYYEVASQEHNKWNSHLLGARQLLVETDFLSTTKRIRRMRSQKNIRRSLSNNQGYSQFPSEAAAQMYKRMEDTYLGPSRAVDDDLLAKLVGQTPRYAQAGMVELETNSSPDTIAAQGPMTPREIDDYDLRCDLYWWYLKQDVIQSIISTNGLLLDYEKWTDVPPRAPYNQPNAVYGTYDHLILLMGRLANFAARDLSRKRRAEVANGGMFKPQASMDGGVTRPPGSSGKPGSISGLSISSNPSQMSAQQKMMMTMMQQGPPMVGMVPAAPAAQMPRGFMPEDGPSPASTQEDQDFELATVQAEEEWNGIKEALETFESGLGSTFRPLSPEDRPPTATPFGPALYYASPAIALIWQWYHTALIVHHRVHPSMPPAAMIAAGIAARHSAHSANEIGRIAAGVEPIAPGFGDLISDSAATDIGLGLFFAGIQYIDPAQRGWTVSKLRSTTERVGWDTGDTIASGCERAWEKAAEMGRGPPYIRTMNPWAKDDRVAGRPFDPTNPITDENDRRYMISNPGARVHWALGVLGLENGVKNLRV
ncbi:MAG: hypothetical protein M1814_004606 [Vezdaea aestivalis]|nr:MAG: hypothetical protein M1814_004606 [Vezdaea aestivalis]